MKILLDTSVLVSFFIRDAHSEKAELIFTKIFNCELEAFTTRLVLAEMCGVLSRNAGIENAQHAFSKADEWVLRGITKVVSETPIAGKVACGLALKYAVKGADAMIAALTLQSNLKLATFDDELKNRLKNKIDFY